MCCKIIKDVHLQLWFFINVWIKIPHTSLAKIVDNKDDMNFMKLETNNQHKIEGTKIAILAHSLPIKEIDANLIQVCNHRGISSCKYPKFWTSKTKGEWEMQKCNLDVTES